MTMSKPLNYIKIVDILSDEQFELEVGSFNLSINEDSSIDLVIKSINDDTDFKLSFPDFREKQVEVSLFINGKLKLKLDNIILKIILLINPKEIKFTFLKEVVR